MDILHFYRRPILSQSDKNSLLHVLRDIFSFDVLDIDTEYCFNVGVIEELSRDELDILRWLLSETFEPENFSSVSFLGQVSETGGFVVEVGPRMNFTTAWSTNAVSICHGCGLKKIVRIERSRRYKLYTNRRDLRREILLREFGEEYLRFLNLIHDRMTECEYLEPLKTFETGKEPEPVYYVPLIEKGVEALKDINMKMGLGFDDWDINYYYNLFVNELRRNPTNVECFDLAQSNSEHSRHWFFKGRLIIDNKEIPHTLLDLIKEPLKNNPQNSIIAFKDNSSAIKGFNVTTIIPENPNLPARFKKENVFYHVIFTAETHNFPTGVAPFPGAETGTGGRIRDVHATGRGSLVIAGTAAYCVGNLRIPGYVLPWEDTSFNYPFNIASPLQIEIEASNGASDYGNKFGEPVIQGFTRSFGLRTPNGERREWIKPIMFTGGVGQIDSRHIEKGKPEKGMLVVKVGGPAYRIGIGGGSASSMIQGENVEELDFSAVQRGDAEMEQKLNRVIRACVEMGDKNPIVSIHDQGAGGNCNVVKEIIYPEGARIDIRKILLGDSTLSVLEIWGAEYQENDALLIKREDIDLFTQLCKREKVPFSVIGEITGDGYIVLYDEKDGTTPVNLELSKILGDMPQKEFHIDTEHIKLKPLRLPKDISIREALNRVLRLLSVGSKRFLTNKVDRSVTGLIAQQQCVGPLQITLSDVAVVAQSHFDYTGSAISIGECPIIGLIDPEAMARMSVGEAITNIMWAKLTRLEDLKCSANWMWAAKLKGEGANIYKAAVSLRDIMIKLGIAIDGGKDSLSMAAKVFSESGREEVVKAPGALVISAYAPCLDVRKIITPYIKKPGESKLIYVDIGKGKYRVGGSAFAYVYRQLGKVPPDLDDVNLLKGTFNLIQELIDKDLILSGHDRSEGGLIVALLEMAFAGNCGIEIDMNFKRVMNERDSLKVLFSEELGVIIEYLQEHEEYILELIRKHRVPFQVIGRTLREKIVSLSINGIQILNEDMRNLRAIWEETSYRLDRLQANIECVDEERRINFDRKGMTYRLSFVPKETPEDLIMRDRKPKVAIVREEGSNGDREMAAAFYHAGFDVWDVTMTDLLEERISLREFRGVAFVGGFSYADVLDSAKGWAGVIKYNDLLYKEFQEFYSRPDTFSLGVCNGCQLMALLGWVPWYGIADIKKPRFIRNKSNRFESRFLAVRILPSPSIMLKGMEDSILGIWIAHGEGRVFFPDEDIEKAVIDKWLAPLRYVNDDGEVTESYPFNPNGSRYGIAALCSTDGRHLAMMPHPERTFLKWQWAYLPEEWKIGLNVSPWIKMFQNAREWCEKDPF